VAAGSPSSLSTVRSPRRSTRSASAAADSSASAAKLIWTLTMPSSVQYTSSNASSSADSSSVSATPAPNGTASQGAAASPWTTIAAAPDTNARPMPGTKWWMCRPPELRSRNGPKRPRRRMTCVDRRAHANATVNEPTRFSSAFSRRVPAW